MYSHLLVTVASFYFILIYFIFFNTVYTFFCVCRFDGKKRRPMGKARQEREKLLHKYKREMKGAIREIRRDKSFLAKLKFKETLQK